MKNNRLDIYRAFAKNIEYPMVVFEAETGKVLEMNYDAEILLGKGVGTICVESGRSMTSTNFWEMLHSRKSMIWHRIHLLVDDKEILVSGLINEAVVNDVLIYSLLFERRADLNIGSITLERIVNHANIVAIHLCRDDDGMVIDYVTQNINRYGYTRAQVYEKKVSTEDIICQEDLEKIKSYITKDISRKMDEGIMECRIVSEQRQLIPVRLLMHYVYNEYGNLSAIEILIVDLSEELKKNKERGYLNKAISKMKSVVLVKSYTKGQRELLYISPNAEMVGMNVEALIKGYKLTEDYIHPEDRDSVIDTIYQAIDKGMMDYVQEYRMVRDDGRRIWVENVITVNRISDGEAEISFLLTDITERKELENELILPVVQPGGISEGVKNTTTDENGDDIITQLKNLAMVLGANSDYYIMMLDLNGKQMFQPMGAGGNIGVFYDLFERPEFKPKFLEMAERISTDKIPQSTSFAMDSLTINMVFAPIIMDTEVTSYWVMANFGTNGLEQLSGIIEAQWNLVNHVAKCFYVDERIEKENHRNKLLEVRLLREQEARGLIEELVYTISKLGAAGLNELCQKAGNYLNITDIGIYRQNKKSKNLEKYYEWSRKGTDASAFKGIETSASEYEAVRKYFEKDKILAADKNTEDDFLKELLKRTGMSGVVLSQLKINREICGYVMFADRDANREFDKSTIRMIKMLTELIGRALSEEGGSTKTDLLQEGFFNAYDHIRDAVFIKDNRSGDIIFANKATEKLFGYSLVGRQANEIINDQLQQYRSIQGVRRRLIADKKVTKWQCYMKELDQIMNIVEVYLDTINGAECSLIILKKNKNKDKKKDEKKNS